MSMGPDVAVTASTHNGTAWQPLPQLLSPNASLLLLISSAIKFRASVPDCNRVLATLEYCSAAPVSPSAHEIARIMVIVNDMGNYGCYNDCSTAEPVPLLAVSTIVIVNYGWFSHKWLLRPGVLLGAATGIGMLLIVIASVCSWLYLVNRLLSARRKVQKIISSFGVADGVLLKDEGQQAQNATETAGDGYAQDEVQVNRHLQYADTIEAYTKEGFPEYGVAADLHVDYCSQDTSSASGASNVISGDGMPNSVTVDVVRGANEAVDVITRAGIHDYAQADYPVGATWPCQLSSPGKGLPIEAIHAPDLAGCVQSTDSFENNCPANDTMQAIYDPNSSSDFQSSKTGGHFQITNTIDHDLDGCLLAANPKADVHMSFGDGHDTIAEEGPLEGIGFHDLDGYTLPCHLEAPDQQSLPTNFTNKLENTCTTNQIDGTPYSVPCRLDYQVDKEGMQHLLGSSMVSRVALQEEPQERSRCSFANRKNIMPASLSSSLTDNHLNQQKDKQACNDFERHSLESYENTVDDQSSAANRSQNKYPNQVDNEGVAINNVFSSFSSMPFGDSSSSSQSCTSTEEDRANLERTTSIEPITGVHGKLEEDELCAFNTNTRNPCLNSHLAERFGEERSQMPELKLVLELPETSNVNENLDPLDHNLVFSSLETDADGSLVAILSQSL